MAFTTSEYLHTKIMRKVFYNENFTVPGTLYVALFSSIPDIQDNGGVEISVTEYERQPMTSTDWTLISGFPHFQYANTSQIQWAIPLTDWPEIYGAGIYDAATGGNQYWTYTSTSPFSVYTGIQFKIPAGNLIVGLT